MKILKDIIAQHGYITSEQIGELARNHASLPVVIKWARAWREQVPASEAIKTMAQGDEMDYVREVFLSSETYDQVKKSLTV
tara:strand:- start:1387 stop:1629 length:243 start_codon:yes stop_codon:yes gene_type:complete